MRSIGEKPHAVFVPYPTQGHINPLLQLAELLHYRGFHITFVNTEINHERVLKSSGPNTVDHLPDFRFETIPDGLPPSATRDVPTLCESTSKNCLEPFRKLLDKLNDSDVPPVTCIFFDIPMSFSLTAAEEIGVPGVGVWTASVCGFMAYLQYPQLDDRGLTVAKGVNYLSEKYKHTPIDWVPGLKDIRLKDMINFDRLGDTRDFMVKFTYEQAKRCFNASAIVFNTFEALEHDVLEALKSQLPPIYNIGPLHLLCKNVIKDGSSLVDSNLWKQDEACIEWLDSKEPNSVIYVNFGSITVMSPESLAEFAWGLANSNQYFLWVIRPDLVGGDDTEALPPKFLTETKGRGLIVSWCSQEEVLNHSSVGGFLSHTGWNSTVESVCGGVPMICWPLFAEQRMNCRFACTAWGMGLEMETEVKREEVERLVRDILEGEKGSEMKKRALDWKRKAEEAISIGGSSFLDLEKLQKEVLFSNRK
ncbi:7-deoxyloganetin glucosyltransferase-like [Telopea speciosissima]|uniref:7-deoxyloganetin glucosyltransferase-like n=1 Tax=Telopea speciosissima TaxID=54955 RepID=UPI001CC7EB57|nr:7-deoxyloganetin glucosyltransferase-like [Telopea speciosissima]